jgi:hypothetical protein
MPHNKSQHPKNHPTADQHQNQREKETTNRHVYVEPGVQIDLVTDLKKQYEASQAESTAHGKKILFWTKASAGLLFIYVALTWWQARSTQKLVKLSQDTYSAAYRPFVMVAPVMANDWRKDNEIGITLVPKNYSTYPAINAVHTKPKVMLTPDTAAVARECAHPIYEEKDKVHTIAPLSAGVIEAMPSAYSEKLTEAQKDRIERGIDKAVIFGAIKYTGGAGGDYETRYCYEMRPTGMQFGLCGVSECEVTK